MRGKKGKTTCREPTDTLVSGSVPFVFCFVQSVVTQCGQETKIITDVYFFYKLQKITYLCTSNVARVLKLYYE